MSDLWESEVKVIAWPLPEDFHSITITSISSKATWPIFTPLAERRKFVQIVQVKWPTWLSCLFMVKNFTFLLLSNQWIDCLEIWYVALGTGLLLRLFKKWPLVDLRLFYGKIKYGKILEHKISWKILKIFYLKSSNDDIGLTLTFSWQDQICFPGFHMGRVYGTCRRFGCKVNKCI